jgi:cyclopropane-fatty-acyl-phospholipid synthase
MDENREEILKIFKDELSKEEARQTFNRWRIFFLACAETFRFRNGQEWWVSHYLFKKS